MLPACRLLTPLLIVCAATASAAGAQSVPQPGLPARLTDLRARAQPDSVELLVAGALPAAMARGDSALVDTLRLERGMTRVAYGRASDAESDLRAALAGATARGDSAAALRALRYLAEACQHLGRRDESAALFAALRDRARAADDDFHTGKALYGLGRLRYRARDLGAADSLYALALPLLAANGDAADLAAVRNGLGMCRAGQGAYRAASTQFELAARLAREGGSRSLEAMAINNLAGLETLLGDPGAAATGYRRARDIQRDLGLWQQVGAPWRNLAQSLTDLGLLDDAAAELDSALAFCRAHGFGDEETFTLVRQAEVDLAAGRPAKALARCELVIHRKPEADLESDVTARVRAADALMALGRGSEALATLDGAAMRLAGHDDFALAMLLAAARSRVQRHLDRHVEALADLQPALARTAAPEAARQRLPLLVGAAESWIALGRADSARVHLDQAAAIWERERALPTDPQWRERRGADAQQLFALRLQIEMASGDVRAAFAEAQRYKARTLLERYLGPGEQLAAPDQVPVPATIGSLQQETLRPGELLLDIVAGTRQGWLFAVTCDTCLVRRLPGEGIWRESLEPLSRQVGDPFRTCELALARTLRDSLLGTAESPVATLASESRAILVSPDGALHRLPLALLPGWEEADLRLVPSATLLAHLRVAPRRAPVPVRLLALAGGTGSRARRLDGARGEVAELRRRYRGVSVVRAAAGDTAAFGGLDPAGYDVLHLASHAEIDPQRPWNSALIFGSAERPTRVRAADIARRKLAARLAVLSSCASAGGAVLAGEGVPGLAAAFLSAGVPGVVGTLWPVEDQATRHFVARFYAAVADGETPARALVAARRALRADPATAHPFFWAGFVLLGEGDGDLDLRRRPALASWLPVPVVMLVIAAAMTARRRRRDGSRPQRTSRHKDDRTHPG